MAFGDSIAGRFGSAIWSRNPMLGVGLGVGAVTGVYAGARTFASEEGGYGDRARSAGSSAGTSLLVGTLGTAGFLTAAPYIPGAVPGTARFTANTVSKYIGGMRKDFATGGMYKVLERKVFTAGAGAAIGAAIGSRLDRDDPAQGARRGAVIGGASGLAISTGIRASRFWKRIGPVGRVGVFAGLSAAALGGSSAMTRQRYETVDAAQPQDYGLRSRMDSMSATGDLVLGLHNSR